MKFEHLIEVNDSKNPMSYQVSLNELWQGLLHRAQDPKHYLHGVETDTILSQADHAIDRELSFGQFAVKMRVEWQDEKSVKYRTYPLENDEGGYMQMIIETPDDERLFVRFIYDTPQEHKVEDGVDVGAYLKSAYLQTDLDLIRQIRAKAEAGDWQDHHQCH